MDLGMPETASYRFGDVEVDVRRHRTVRGGVELALEPKAQAVLVELLRHAGEVVARDALLDAVWGHRHVTPAVLNRIIAILRRELGDDAEHPRLIRTVHGVGYEFIGALQAAPDDAAGVAPATAPQPSPAAPTPAAQAHHWRWIVPAALAVLAGVAAITLLVRDLSAPPRAPSGAAETATRSIAVLPLANASRDPDQQFFSDGLSESLINALSRFDGLKVIGRSSAFQFRDSKDDSRTIGARLGVSHLLTGSVQHAGDVVRINVALANAADGSTLWAEHYDRPYKDLFALQDEIAQRVAHALQARLLSGARAQRSDRPPGGSIEAYNAYLQGLKYWHDHDFSIAAEHLTRAVQLDPGYAVAWADLSGSWSTVARFSDVDPDAAREHMSEARRAADKALQLAPGLGSAHAARAYLQFYDFDYEGALAECRRAAQLAPDDSMVLSGCGYTLSGSGKLEEAIRLRERLISIEPLYAINYFEYAMLLAGTGRLDDADKYLRIADNLAAPDAETHLAIAVLRGDAQAAQAAAQALPSPRREMALALAAQLSADRTAADATLANVLAHKEWTDADPYRVAQIHALRDDPAATMQWLQRAPERRLQFLLADSLILRFRDDPRLIDFCRSKGLPPPGDSDVLGLDRIRATIVAR